MQVIKKSSSGLQSLPLDAMLLSNRTIFLTGTITTSSVNAILQQLLFLESEDLRTPIRLLITSSGGEIQAGLALYDQLKGMTVPVEIYCIELAASMAAILLAGGAKGHRFILRHSKVMIHEPLISSASGGIYGSASSIQKTAASILEVKDTLTQILAQDTGRSVDEIERATAYDNFMNAEEAVAFGICDKIVDHI